MSGPASLAIATGVLVDAGLKATVLLGLGFSATHFLRHRSAAQRHAVWACAFAALPVLPLLAGLRGASIAIDAPWLVGVWAVGAMVAAAPLLRGLTALARLRRGARAAPGAPGLLYSDHVAGPITWGLWRPVIVFPAASGGWSSEQRAAALAHERAHIARRDWAVHLAVWLVCVLFWFHPLVWLARRALGREAEHAADDVVIAQGVRPSAYASLLVALAASGTPQAALGVAASLVGQRVRAVLDTRSRSARRWPAGMAAVVLGAVLAASLGNTPLWSAAPESLTCLPGPLP